MTVYVDDMEAPFGNMIMCHMIADTDEELRAMADKIGVAQRWHQGDHFDIALSKKKLAIKFGAIEITQREAGCMMFCARAGQPMPSPAKSEDQCADLFGIDPPAA